MTPPGRSRGSKEQNLPHDVQSLAQSLVPSDPSMLVWEGVGEEGTGERRRGQGERGGAREE